MLLSENNIQEFRKSFEKLLNFEAAENPAKMVNNYDWYNGMEVLHFLRDIGKYITQHPVSLDNILLSSLLVTIYQR